VFVFYQGQFICARVSYCVLCVFVVVWLSVPVQSIAWKDSSAIVCRVECSTLHTHSFTLLALSGGATC